MPQQFPLFQTPLDAAHAYWRQLLKPGNLVIDATCGNGHDTLVLTAICATSGGKVIAIATQEAAIKNTRERINGNIPEPLQKNVDYYRQCHSTFPAHIAANSAALIVYNLGYLPGGNKELTTLRSTTLQSLEAALPLISPGGAISIMCYPGHSEGKIAAEAVGNFAASLNPKEWSCCHHRWVNRTASPSLLLILKSW